MSTSDRAAGDRLAAASAVLLNPPSERSNIASFIVMDVMRAAAVAEAAGRHVIHMEVGQPATAAPKAAREAVKAALDRDTLGYTLALGMYPLRARIARLYRDWYGVDVSPERVVVTSGSSAAFVLTFLALFDVGFYTETLRQTNLDPSLNGYDTLVKALELRGPDAEMEFALALATSWPKRPEQTIHLTHARAGAKDNALLAANLASHFSNS